MLHGLPMRCVFSLLLSLVLALALAFAPRAAWAQATSGAPSVSGIEGAVLRCEPPVTGGCNNADNTGGNPHPNGILDNTINFEDCEANLYYQFELGISNPSSSYDLEAWVGTEDCSQLANRQTSATSVCWPVAPFYASLVNPYLMNVRIRDIASGVFTTTHPVTYVATGLDNTDDAVCQSQTQTGGTALVLYMFFADAEGNPYNTVQQYPITLDMRAGDVQGNISVGVGDTVLIVSIPQTTDPATQGYNLYCDPPPGQETASETVPVDAPTNNGLCAAQVPDTGTTVATDALASVSEDGATEDSGSGVANVDDAGGNACGAILNDAGIPSPGGCTTSTVLVPGGTSSNLVAVTDEAGNTIYEEASASSGLIETEGGATVSGGTMVMGLQYNQAITARIPLWIRVGFVDQHQRDRAEGRLLLQHRGRGRGRLGERRPPLERRVRRAGAGRRLLAALLRRGRPSRRRILFFARGRHARRNERAWNLDGGFDRGDGPEAEAFVTFVSRWAALGLGLGLMATGGRASADDNSVLDTRHDRGASPQNFAVEVRVALYQPQVNSDPALHGATPYASTFGTGFYFEGAMELDWQAIRIPDVGTLGPGISVGYTNMSGTAQRIDGGYPPSAESTTLEILPIYLVGVFRLDTLWRQLHVPLVPYAKAGLALRTVACVEHGRDVRRAERRGRRGAHLGHAVRGRARVQHRGPRPDLGAPARRGDGD